MTVSMNSWLISQEVRFVFAARTIEIKKPEYFFMYFNPSHKDFSHLDHIVFNAQCYESNKILKKIIQRMCDVYDVNLNL